ncbi:MAG: hypothetical protein NVS2B12_35930 [Ktedonobacteraceae bacterium]
MAQQHEQIGEYRLIRQLGKGTFGTVYLAEHLHDQSQVAIKILQLQLTSSKDLRDFLNEARVIRLRHPHILPVLDFGLSRDDVPFLVLEYAAGGTLRDLHPRGNRVPWQDIDSYLLALASALQYAHGRRTTHRDIKPENVLRHSDGTVLLSDFGIAKIMEQSTMLSMQTQIGTPLYMAPNKARASLNQPATSIPWPPSPTNGSRASASFKGEHWMSCSSTALMLLLPCVPWSLRFPKRSSRSS